jgi:NAD(P)-dependent dehydrogenase (short-subunit alcohol dehydrogenase family)
MSEIPKYNRTVLVAGAAGGLGSALAVQLAKAGADLILLDKNRRGLGEVSDRIVDSGAEEPGLYPLDFEGASADDYADLAHVLQQQYGGVDTLIHCAAHFTGLFPSEHLPGDEWLRTMQVNLNAPWLLTKTCIPLLRDSGQGQVVWMLDSENRATAANWGAYGVAKQALRTLISQMTEELSTTDIAVCGINPGPMNTVLRGQAYIEEDKTLVAAPEQVAARICELLQHSQIQGILDFETEV